MIEVMWWWLLALVAISVIGPSTWPKATVHDPISALISSVVEGIGGLFGAGDLLGLGSLFGGEAAAGAGTAAAAGAADAALPAIEAGGAIGFGGAGPAAAAVAPELASGAIPFVSGGSGLVGGLDLGAGALSAGTALAGAAGGGAADVLGALGPGVGTAGGGALDFAGGGDLAATGTGGLSTSVPGANALTSVAPLGAAATPAAAAPPAEFLAASSLDPTAASSAATGGAGSAGPLSGPVAGNLPMTFEAGPGTTVNSFDAATGATTAGGGAGGSSSLLSKIGLGGAETFAKDNSGLLTLGAAGIPLAAMLFQGNPTLPGEKAATANTGLLTNLAGADFQQAQNLTAEGQALTGNAMSGVLPPGFESAIEQAKNAATTKVGNTYGSLNLSGSTSEAVDKANVAASVDAQRATILNDLLSKGITASNAGTSALNAAGGALGSAGSQDLALAKLQLEQDQELQKALQSLASNLVLASIPARTTTTTTTA